MYPKIRCPRFHRPGLSKGDLRARTCVTRNSTMRPSGKRYLHHCSFKREENQRIGDKLITLMKKGCCQLNHFFAHSRTVRPVHELTSLSSCREKPSRESETIMILLERHKEQILADFRAEIQKHEFQADSCSKKVSRNWMELSSLSEEKLMILLQEMNNFDDINFFFQNNYQNKIEIFVKLLSEVLVSRPSASSTPLTGTRSLAFASAPRFLLNQSCVQSQCSLVS